MYLARTELQVDGRDAWTAPNARVALKLLELLDCVPVGVLAAALGVGADPEVELVDVNLAVTGGGLDVRELGSDVPSAHDSGS